LTIFLASRTGLISVLAQSRS